MIMKNAKSQSLKSAESDYKEISRLVFNHNKYFSESLNLIASENSFSTSIQTALASDLNNRVAEGWINKRYYPGMKYYDKIERIGIKTVKEMFSYDHVDLRPISGSLANMAVYTALTSPNDNIITLRINDGAHISMGGGLLKKVFKLNVFPIPFNEQEMNIDIPGSIELIKKIRPKLVILGGSVILFPQPLSEISKAAHKEGSIVLYDASHVAGLIAGQRFQNPSKEGADIVTFTTCKTIPGPQSAVILSRKKFAEPLKNAIFPVLMSGHHLHETVGAIMALLELKTFGKKLATDTINNAQTLGRELYNKGFSVLAKDFGFTKSHMLIIDCQKMGGGEAVERKLESVKIIVNRNVIPSSNDDYKNPSGIRIGTQELTHFGMGPDEMKLIAELFQNLLINSLDKEIINKKVVELRNKFQTVKYTFSDND